jgi:hypothetical protein
MGQILYVAYIDTKAGAVHFFRARVPRPGRKGIRPVIRKPGLSGAPRRSDAVGSRLQAGPVSEVVA